MEMDQFDEWRDRHVLTDDLREAFERDIKSPSLSVRIQRTCSLTAPLKCLELLRINYKVTWPISDIVQGQLDTYQQICTFLLQIHRTKYLLNRISAISQRRERKKLPGDAHIVHAVRLELLWFINVLLYHVGVVVSL